MPANSADHLSPHVLRALAAGRLHAAAAGDVFAHLDSCAGCQQAGVALLGDSFLVQLRAARPPAATLVEALAAADTAGPGPAQTTSQTAPSVLPELSDHPQYEILRELGRGGMGVVYLAKNKLMDRPEVLKVVNPQVLGQAGAAERFLREIRSAARLSHPNVVAAYSALQVGELLAFAMEYIQGEDLNQVVKAQGRLPVANACYYTSQVALGLQHAFEKGMVHRDIKPQNLILTRAGKKHVVKVLDFGLAKATREGEEADRGLTGTGWMLGTPDYIAPEQTLDAARADIRADIYSLGCTLYFLLTGSPPFQGKSQFELLQAHHAKEATLLDRVRPDVPTELAAVVARMMAKDPALRYQQPAEVAQALAPFVKAGLKPLPPGPATETAKAGATPAPPTAGKTDAKKKVGPDTATRAPVVTGTVVEGSAMAAQGIKKADTGQARAELAAPMERGTVVEGGAPIARPIKKLPEKETASSRKHQNDDAEEPEPRQANRAKKNQARVRIGLAIGGAVLGLLCVIIIVILNQGSSAPPSDAKAGGSGGPGEQKGPPPVDKGPNNKPIDKPVEVSSNKITRENFDKLKVGMTLTQMEDLLGMGKPATAGEIASAFGWTADENSRRLSWSNAGKESRVHIWSEHNNIILAVFPEQPVAGSSAAAFCYSYITPDYHRLSNQVGSFLTKGVTPDNFNRLTVGMTLTQVEAVLGIGRRATASGDLPPALSSSTAWINAVNGNRVQVWQEGQERILAAFPGSASAGSKVEILYSSRFSAQQPADKWVVSKENFAKLRVGMTLREVAVTLGMGKAVATFGDFLYVPSYGENEKAYWSKAVKEKRAYLWTGVKNGTYTIIQAGFSQFPSAGARVVALYYWDVRGAEHKGPLPRAGLAIELATMQKSYGDKWDLPSKSQVQIALVHAGGGGAKMGLRRDDVVLRINSRDVLTTKQADIALSGLKTGASVEFVVVRAGKQLELIGAYATEFAASAEVPRLLAMAARDPRVREILGRRYALGLGVARNDAEAVKWYRKGADAGNAVCQDNLGYNYLYGLGLPKNEEEALKWFRKAADQDYANAQNNLGFAYGVGLGVSKDLKQAVQWYKKAADQDNPYALANLGWMYENGQGVLKNPVEAVKWYKRAVVRDNPVGQRNLASMYERAQGGLTYNITEAVRLYRLAADQGDQFAKDRLRALGY